MIGGPASRAAIHAIGHPLMTRTVRFYRGELALATS